MRTCILLPVLLGAVFASAQTPADMAAEPHYHLLLENDQVRVFSLTLRPTEQAFTRHEHNFLLITLQDSELVIWAEGSSPVQNFRFRQGDTGFYLGGHASGLRNDRSSAYHGIVVEFLNPKVTTYGYQYPSGDWSFGSGTIGPPVDPHAKFVDRLTLGAASAADVQLLAEDSLPPPGKPVAELLIPITDVDFRAHGDVHVRKSPGEAWWIPARRTSELVNASGGPERFVMVELPTASH
jgi:hypothetical protein